MNNLEETIQTQVVKKITFTQRFRWIKKQIKKHKLFITTVVIPTYIAFFYYGFIASDVYISESQFVVRSPEKSMSMGIGAMLQSTGITSSNDDVYTVKDFILSRDALELLNNDLKYRELYSTQEADIFSRLNGFDLDASFENMFKYYKNNLEVEINSQSSIITLRVESFKASDAKNINDYLVRISEELVNRLNKRGRNDLIGFAEAEVERATTRLAKSSSDISNFRQEKAVFNLETQSNIQLKLISKIQDQLILTHSQLAQLKSLSPKNSQIKLLNNKIQSLKKQIDLETTKIVGSENSYSQKSSEFEKLLLQREYSTKQLVITLASLEDARNEAMRQQLYIERISKANLPDIALEPKRIISIVTVWLLGLITWAILSMLIAGIREHND